MIENFVKNSRFAFFGILIFLELFIFVGVRVGLIGLSFDSFDHNIQNYFKIFSYGFIYDIAFLSYFNLLLVLYLCFISQQYYEKGYVRFITNIFIFFSMAILLFSSIAEFLFWDEFSVRFNFISVDYLIYRREVSENVNQSYPVVWIFTLLFIVSFIITYSLNKFVYTFQRSSERISTRLYFTGVYLLFLLLCAGFLDQSLREKIKNNFVKELASNGPYQFFAAFRNNTLDYRVFYALDDDRLLSEKLLKLVDKKSPTSKVFDIERSVIYEKDEKKYNVILISVESLSASFMAHFGNAEKLTPYLDELVSKSLSFNHFYATGTRTTRGLEAITLSVPPTPGRSIVKRPENDGYPSVGQVFKDHGYDCAYLYGGRAYFDNMRNFFLGNG